MIVARYEVPGIASHRGPSRRARYELYHNARSTRKTLLADRIIPFPTGRVFAVRDSRHFVPGYYHSVVYVALSPLHGG
jgi:hypothetical protein